MRRTIELYINGARVDLDADALILFNYRFEDMSNPTIVKNSYSQTITLKNTDTNNQVFGAFYRSDRMIAGAQFDPKRKVPFQIFDGGTLLESGYAKLEQVITKNGQAHEYKVGLYGGLGSFFYALSYDDNGNKRTLASLDFGRSIDFTINASTVYQAWNALQAGPYSNVSKWNIVNFAPCYNGIPSDDFDPDKMIVRAADCGLRDNITDGDDVYRTYQGMTLVKLGRKVNEWEAHDLRSYLQRAVLRFRAVLAACCDPNQNGGFTVNLDQTFFSDDNPYYNDLWLALPQIHKLTGLTDGETGTFSIPTTGGTGQFEAVIDLDIPFGTKVAVTVGARLVAELTDAYTGGTLYSSQVDGTGSTPKWDTYCWLIQAVGYDPNGAAVAGSPVEIIQSAVAGVQYTAYDVAREIGYVPPFNAGYDAQNLTGAFTYTDGAWVWNKDIQFAFEGANVSRIGINVIAARVIDDGQSAGPVFLQVNNTIKLFETQSSVPNTAHTISDTHLTGISGANTYEYAEASSVRSGANITQAALLTTDHSPADYLLAFAKVFGLQFMVDREAKTVTIMTRDTFFSLYASNVIDLTDRVDRSQDITVSPFLFSTKWLELSFDAEGIQYAEEYANAYGRKYGAARIDTGFEFNSETKELLEDLAVTGGVEVLERSKMFNNITENGKQVPSAFLDSGEYTLYKAGVPGDDKAFPLTVPTAAAAIDYWNDVYLGYDEHSKPQFHGTEQKELEIRDTLLLFGGKVYHDPKYHGRLMITDDDEYMAALNDNTPCWHGGNFGVSFNVEYYPIFGRYNWAGTKITRSLDFSMPAEIDIPGVSFKEDAGIYERYWRRFLAGRYDDDARVMKCSVDLAGLSVDAELLRRFYYYDGAIWSLNAIENHSITTLDPTKCEFVKVIDIQDYTNGQESGGGVLSVLPGSIVFNPYGEAVGLDVTASGPWTAQVIGMTGVTLSAASGTGNAHITATAAENAGAAQAGSIVFTLTATGDTATVTASQGATGEAGVTPTALEFAAPGKLWREDPFEAWTPQTHNVYGFYDLAVTVEAPDATWRITSKPSWVKIYRDGNEIAVDAVQTGAATVRAWADENYAQTDRAGTITFAFAHAGATTTQAVSVSQRSEFWSVLRVERNSIGTDRIEESGGVVDVYSTNGAQNIFAKYTLYSNGRSFQGMEFEGFDLSGKLVPYPENQITRSDTTIDDGCVSTGVIEIGGWLIAVTKPVRCYPTSLGGFGRFRADVLVGTEWREYTNLYIHPHAASIVPYLLINTQDVSIGPDGSAQVEVSTNSFWMVGQSDLYDARMLIRYGALPPSDYSYMRGIYPYYAEGLTAGVRLQPQINYTGAERTLRATFFTGDADIINADEIHGGVLMSVIIRQAALVWSIVTPAARPATAGSFNLELQSNLEDQVIGLQGLSASSSESWCTVSTNGSGLPITVSVEANTTGAQRTAVVTVNCNKDGSSHTVTITQEA